MTKIPRLSVIIPIYNAQNYLEISLKTILNQTFTDFELICINDGSTDKSLNILKNIAKKDNRIKIINQKNFGAAVARNNGLKIAKGEAVIILDADDIFNKNFFKIMYNELKKSQTDIVICQFNIFNQLTNSFFPSRKLPNEDLAGKIISPDLVKKRIFQITNAASWNKIFLKNLIITNKILFKDFRPIDDLNFTFLALSTASKIKMINKVLVSYRANTKVSQTDKINLKTFKSMGAFDILKTELKERNSFYQFKFSFYIAKLESFLWLIKKTFINSP